jgi:hypothetical protein
MMIIIKKEREPDGTVLSLIKESDDYYKVKRMYMSNSF